VGTTVLLVGGGLAAGASYAAQTGNLDQLRRVGLGALVQLPAAWVLTGIVMASFGLIPRWTVAGWTALVAFLLLGEIGPLVDLPQWMMDISPFAHVPRLPGGQITIVPLVVLTGVAVALIVAGLAGFRRRDIISS
jgi:ABC-2 type transport system permease protein